MLNEKEKTGIHGILKYLTDKDLFSLAETVTNRMLCFETSEEACTAILSYASTAIDVLKRRKVKKEYIFQYLHQAGYAVLPQSSKKDVVEAALRFWGSDVKDWDRETLEEDTMMVEEITEPATSSGVISVVVPNSIRGPDSSGVISVVVPNSIQTPEVNPEMNEMAQQFVRWFYPMLNNGHVAASAANSGESFGPHHFWRDCQLKVSTPHYEHLVEGNGSVASKLLSLIGQQQLYFNPLDEEQGIRCSLEPHGLVLILVGGGLHRGDLCIGLYEQKFGLIRDPSTGNNWKIKFTELRMVGKDLELCPIDDFDDVQLALDYP